MQSLFNSWEPRSIAGDALNPSSIRADLESRHPEAVVHALTAIPKRGPWRASDLEQTNDLRIRGTKHLLDAAIAVGARRLVVESMVFIYGYGDLGTDGITEETRVGERVPQSVAVPVRRRSRLYGDAGA